MTNLPYESHLHLINEREKTFDELYRRGAFAPLLLQIALGNFVLLLIPLVIRHRGPFHSQSLRYGCHAIITLCCFYTIRDVRYLGPANGYVVGLITSWFYIWSTTILIVNDAQKQYKRIVKEYVDVKNDILEGVDGQHGTSTTVHAINDQISRRTATITTPRKPSDSPSKRNLERIYQWQPFPQQLSRRINWASDLIFNFRGPNWNWRLRSLPSLPEAVARDIGEQIASSEHDTRTTTRSKATDNEPAVRLRHALLAFSRDYFVLDLLKLLLMRDPYFWGFVDSPLPPPPWPFSILAWSPILIRAYRTTLSMVSVLFALDYVTNLNPIFFLGLSLAFPNFSRAVTHQPLDESWLYPEAFGPAVSILDHGLIGAWNTWWHQLFRVGFSDCSRFIVDLLLPSGRKEEKQSKGTVTPSYKLVRRTLQVLFAFSLSGLVHALGSYTTFADSKPWDAFMFFFLQGVGVLVQTLLQRAVLPNIIPFAPPKWLVRSTNLIGIVLWFYFTGPLIADDFARAGIWMFEPIPYSPLRGGLGLGTKGDQWHCWRGSWFGWHSGRTWWQSGIRLI